MENKKVYVTDYEYSSLEEEKKELLKYGIELLPRQCRNEDDIIRECQGADGLLNQYASINRRVIEGLPNLKVVARYGVGVNTVDLDAATENGVCVLNVPDYCMDEVSNQAFALIMACQRKLGLLNDQVQQGEWDYKIAKPIYRMAGQTLGLLGFGRIPRMLAKKVKAFGMHVTVYDPYLKAADVAAYGVRLLPVSELLQSADIISVHVPLTTDTCNLISRKEFALMKKNAILVNTSRGQLIDEDALYEAIVNQQISGAGLDVTVQEPLETQSKLRGLPNVIITPHVAWYSEESELELKRKAAHGVAEILAGYDVPNIVNRNVRDKLQLKKREGDGFRAGCND